MTRRADIAKLSDSGRYAGGGVDVNAPRAKPEPKETGIEELRRAAKALSWCNESVLQSIGSAERVLNVARAMWASGWDLYPDQWTPQQIEIAATKGAAGAPKFEERPCGLHALEVEDCICRDCRRERANTEDDQ